MNDYFCNDCLYPSALPPLPDENENPTATEDCYKGL